MQYHSITVPVREDKLQEFYTFMSHLNSDVEVQHRSVSEFTARTADPKPEETKGNDDKPTGLFEIITHNCECRKCYNSLKRNDRIPWRIKLNKDGVNATFTHCDSKSVTPCRGVRKALHKTSKFDDDNMYIYFKKSTPSAIEVELAKHKARYEIDNRRIDIDIKAKEDTIANKRIISAEQRVDGLRKQLAVLEDEIAPLVVMTQKGETVIEAPRANANKARTLIRRRDEIRQLINASKPIIPPAGTTPKVEFNKTNALSLNAARQNSTVTDNDPYEEDEEEGKIRYENRVNRLKNNPNEFIKETNRALGYATDDCPWLKSE